MHITVLMLAANTWGYAFFNFGEWPSWAVVAKEGATTALPLCQPITTANMTGVF